MTHTFAFVCQWLSWLRERVGVDTSDSLTEELPPSFFSFKSPFPQRCPPRGGGRLESVFTGHVDTDRMCN